MNFTNPFAVGAAIIVITMSGCMKDDHPKADHFGDSVSAAVSPMPDDAEKGTQKKTVRSLPNRWSRPSIVHVLAHGDQYDGKKIAIEGYLHVKFEGNAIYLSREDADYGIACNGFWVHFDKQAIPYEGIVGPTQYHKKYVRLEGTYDNEMRGHMSAWSGTIKNVTRIRELESDEEYEERVRQRKINNE